jgi:diaminopimelate epimerase
VNNNEEENQLDVSLTSQKVSWYFFVFCFSTTTMEFLKYSALGNDYIVVDPLPHSSHQQGMVHDEEGKGRWYTSPAAISLVCDRHRGIGSDGILLAISFDLTKKRFGLRIFNSDGSEAEKSGNGLRIFARYIYELIWNRFDLDLLEFILWTPKAGDAKVKVLTPASSKVWPSSSCFLFFSFLFFLFFLFF